MLELSANVALAVIIMVAVSAWRMLGSVHSHSGNALRGGAALCGLGFVYSVVSQQHPLSNIGTLPKKR